jgi:hypothetical protein
MKQVRFARFPNHEQAELGMQRVREAGLGAIEFVVHEPGEGRSDFDQEVKQSSSVAETDLRRSLMIGLGLGLTVGAGFGIFLAAIGVIPGGLLSGAVVGAATGLLVGLLMAVVGSGLMDRRLERVSRNLQPGEVIVTAECEDSPTAERVERLLRQSGGLVVQKSAV